MLPEYLAKAKPNLCTARKPWYLNTAPSYAGVFLWIAFYQSMAVGTIDRAELVPDYMRRAYLPPPRPRPANHPKAKAPTFKPT